MWSKNRTRELPGSLPISTSKRPFFSLLWNKRTATIPGGDRSNYFNQGAKIAKVELCRRKRRSRPASVELLPCFSNKMKMGGALAPLAKIGVPTSRERGQKSPSRWMILCPTAHAALLRRLKELNGFPITQPGAIADTERTLQLNPNDATAPCQMFRRKCTCWQMVPGP